MTIVVKIGGGEGIDPEPTLADLAAMGDSPYVLVHGGSHETNQLSEALGHPPRFVTSISGHTSRYTDAETMEMFTMALAGKVNVSIVARLQQMGVNALGLTGVDGRLLEGPRKDAIKVVEGNRRMVLRGDHTGKVERVNAPLLHLLMEGGYVPVVTVPAISYQGEPVNADADRAAAAVAAAIGAEALVILSNVPGLLRDVNDPESLVPSISRDGIDGSMDLAQGRMRKKVLGAKEALESGVPKVIFASASIERPVTRALEGGGTHIG
jgi:acetylglutamate/LysW-gamma-L-alpha-aminoadipate kinase